MALYRLRHDLPGYGGLMPSDSDISICIEKPGVFTKNTTISIDPVFDPIARCSRLTKNPSSSRAVKETS